MAKNLTGKSPGGERQNLSEILPLDFPIILQIFPIYKCCAQCSFCLFSINEEKRHFVSDVESMPSELYKKCIDDIKNSEKKLLVFRIVGLGEPLMYPYLSDMCRYAKESNIAERVEIITNAIPLSKKLSEELVNYVDRIVISVQGTTSESYKNISNINLNIDKFISNIKYLYNLKEEKNKNLHIYLKIADISLKTKEDKNRFYSMFLNICDSIAIESIVAMHSDIEYSDDIKNKKITQFGKEIQEKVMICNQPFTFLQLNPDGNVVVCYSWEYSLIAGNLYKENLIDIWNGKKINKFRREMLKNNSLEFNKICKKCNMVQHRQFPEDKINEECRKRLLKYYK